MSTRGAGQVPAAVAPGTVTPRVLRDYALIADGERGALLGSGGELAWLCFPSWSDPAVFAQLLGGLGSFEVRPRGRVLAEGRYDDGTLIWTNRWVGEHGDVEARSAFAFPGEPDLAIILRRVTARSRDAIVDVRLAVAADYGRMALGPWRREDDVWVSHGANMTARVVGLAEATCVPAVGGGSELASVVSLDRGSSLDLVLELSVGNTARLSDAARDPGGTWRRTEEAWRATVPECTDTITPRDARRAFAVLRGMTTREGATMAAATTSLPERDEANRNYDYRYGWIRDTCYVGHAGAALDGGAPMLDDAARWVGARLLQDGPNLMPAYLPDGRAVPDVEDLGLPGYPGARDVQGNRARSQFQLDAFGEALCLLSKAAAADRLDDDGFKAMQVAVEAIAQRHAEPDAGIWEIEPDHWTHSKLVCVAGLRGVAACHSTRWLSTKATELADLLLADLARTSVHPSGRWQRSPADARVDAALLLGAVRGAVGHDDPRSIATREAVGTELAEDGYVYRYVAEGASLGETEGAFLICNFWLALACLGAGRRTEAARWFERARGSCGTPGLFCEEYDVEHYQPRGNLPQAFVHAELLEVAASTAWESA